MKTILTTHEPIEVRAEGDAAPVIVGYGAVFFDAAVAGTEYRSSLWDGWTLIERVERGAFDAALADAGDIVALWGHDQTKPLGRRSRQTLKLEVDQRGLRYEITPPGTTWGTDALESIRRGDVTGSSFGFSVADGWQESVDRASKTIVRTIKSVSRLWEVSPVAIPAYAATSAGTRSADDDARLAEIIKRSLDQTDRTRAKVAIALATLDE
jgi:HK97 family phage prohead protease